ncbi:NAD(P)H-hydrate epimerase [Campylobacter sp. faydin G-24]|uniref:Bifunctional NAD(P)H-hydrate repair enzyme n=1 Tax=Campylobacter anatolicus TaxID=2829105 RepID=A0ABS5HG52_9BACT|nr:NAD(P)H-hydrate epimerase [Campylobacter anatolicus]MBR8463254.1 NAD(P)H-hydrate epimerase [Campylobacter anatolicus]
MKGLYLSTAELDSRAVCELGLSEEVLIENAATKIANFIRSKFKKGSRFLGVCGGGNNGADVFAALRMLEGDYQTSYFLASLNLKDMAKKQLESAKKVGVKECENESEFDKFDCIIDGIFGSGLNRNLNEKSVNLINLLNSIKAFKIACDIPSGLDANGVVMGACFKADVTITMGARKLGLYSDVAKEYVGKIKVALLGVSGSKFQTQTDTFLLTKGDLNLPFRDKKNTNKGEFGHAFFISGEHSGAASLAALSASAIGAGLVSVIGGDKTDISVMQAQGISEKMNAGAIGMGLGRDRCGKWLDGINLKTLSQKSLVIDADMCYEPGIIELLSKNSNIVITPHPKEFSSLLRLSGIANVDVSKIQQNRFKFAREFSFKFGCVLVLKGANTIIAQCGKLYIMCYGTVALAKGGSGDVLSGLIAGLMAQGYTPLKAAITGTLAHALSAHKFKKNNYALNPKDIIKGVKCRLKK